jgi:glycosyltransferase involved in cell wall biosynthesis
MRVDEPLEKVGVSTRVRVSVVTPCFNEEGNLKELIARVRAVMAELDVTYEHLVIDNASTDSSLTILKEEAALDPNIHVIVNASNFGHIKSPFHGLMQSQGECAILLSSDLQDPPELITELLARWQNGAKVVLLVKANTEERGPKAWGRRLYYQILGKFSDSRSIPNATGAGAYDATVINYLRELNDPYPYLRGLVAESGYPIETISFYQPLRKAGKTSNNLFSLYDIAMLGFTTHSRTPLRLVAVIGFVMAALSLLVGLIYFIRKLTAWDSFELGLAPLAIGLFFLGAIQLIALGVIGEYIGNIFLRVRGLPLVVESERVNF